MLIHVLYALYRTTLRITVQLHNHKPKRKDRLCFRQIPQTANHFLITQCW